MATTRINTGARDDFGDVWVETSTSTSTSSILANSTNTAANSPLSTVTSASTTGDSTVINVDNSNVSWSTTVVESIAPLSMMRARNIAFNATACKPNTRLYPFFDGIRVDEFVTPNPIVTDSNGSASGNFSVPGNRFQTGSRIFLLSTSTSALSNGNMQGDAAATFQSIGYEQSIRNTTNNLSSTVTTVENVIENVITITPPQPPDIINEVMAPDPAIAAAAERAAIQAQQAAERLWQSNASARLDPLAQSFNTYGLIDGVYVSSIELYFKTKSSSSPVQLEIRTMETGFPTETLVQPHASITKPASEISISDAGSVATKFTFAYPVYLLPNSDYCFVVRSNAIEYNIHVAEMGGISNETGKMITEQPYVGSLFKSENNFTWTAEQYKDIKFKINRAKFKVDAPAIIRSAIEPVPYYVPTDAIKTTSGNRVLQIDLGYFKHGLDTSSKVIITPRDIADVDVTFNGLTGVQMSGEFPVTKVLSDYVFECTLSAGSATSTGKIETTGVITEITVSNSGSGYVAPIISITGGGATIQATATAKVIDGKIVKVTISDAGTGYTSAPTVTVTDGVGVNAKLDANVSDIVLLSTNNVVNTMAAYIPITVVSGTDIKAEITKTDTSYVGAGSKSYNLNGLNNLAANVLVASRENEVARMSNNDSSVLTTTLVSNSDYVSPIINFENAAVTTYTFHINNQDFETVDSTIVAGTAGVASYIVTNGGTYASVPTITMSAPSNGGVTATGTVVLSGGSTGSIVSITPGLAGTLYTYPPTATISGGGAGAVTPVLVAYNSELTPNRGNALSRYISNKTKLVTPSTSATIFVDAYSHDRSSFEVYFRSTNSADASIHEDQNWKMMSCDVDRNKSTRVDEFLEYTFKIENLPEFDTFDIKIVLRSLDSFNPPIISNYRAIVTV